MATGRRCPRLRSSSSATFPGRPQPGRLWPRSVVVLLARRAQTTRHDAEKAERRRRRLGEDLLEVPRREREAGHGLLRHDLRDPRLLVDHRKLAEEVARPELGDLLAVANDPGAACGQHEQTGADLPLADDRSTGLEFDLHGMVRRGGEDVLGKCGKEIYPAEHVRLLFAAQGHRRRHLALAASCAGYTMILRRQGGQARLRFRAARRSRTRMAGQDEIADTLAGLAMFSDLSTPQLQSVAHTFEERFFPEGERILRQGLTGSGFFVILDGQCSILVDGQQRATLSRGDFFGEVSILLGEPPVADVVATTPVRTLFLAGPAVESFLVGQPRVMYRMLQSQARRLRNANRWRS